MSDIAIKVEDVGKLYRLGEVGTGTLSQDLKRWWAITRGNEDPFAKIGETNDRTQKGSSDYVWALKDVSFEVKQGEVLGIIGRNGAGKSTLLKLLSKVTQPSTGNIKIKGRIASLLEVGTGFHPDLTGRENVFLNGAILGMTKAEVKKKFDEIVDFAGVERYIDTPVKRYSSGMYVRLAFAVAAFLEPEILIIDEVLAVGDAEFQKKCLGRMHDVSVNDGRSVLFVSHNMGAILNLCQKGLLLDKGGVEKKGGITEVVSHYFFLGIDRNEKQPVDKYRNYKISEAPVIIEDVFVEGHEQVMPQLNMGEPIEIIVRTKVRENINGASITLAFFNAEGVQTDMAFSWDDEFYLNLETGTYDICFAPTQLTLPPGRYTMSVGLSQGYYTNAWDGISYYPIFEIENRSVVRHWDSRPWAIHHLEKNNWSITKK
jgi:ABC-type polysaccharide/polyol phosphate transport system ATPase subunit